MFEGKEGTQQEKLDFTVHLSCSKFMVGHLSHKDILTELLKSGQLVSKIRKEIMPSQDFDAILSLICRKCNLTLVEQIDDTASLYGHSLKGHHVCLLLKYNVSWTVLLFSLFSELFITINFKNTQIFVLIYSKNIFQYFIVNY